MPVVNTSKRSKKNIGPVTMNQINNDFGTNKDLIDIEQEQIHIQNLSLAKDIVPDIKVVAKPVMRKTKYASKKHVRHINNEVLSSSAILNKELEDEQPIFDDTDTEEEDIEKVTTHTGKQRVLGKKKKAKIQDSVSVNQINSKNIVDILATNNVPILNSKAIFLDKNTNSINVNTTVPKYIYDTTMDINNKPGEIIGIIWKTV